ncbi:MAG: ParB/RepB/Spo0J family partition protein [Acidobacteriota bacterium]
MKRQALGRGLDALLPKSKSAQNLIDIDLLTIRPNAFQPRLHIEAQALEELAASISENGILQPVVVRSTPGGYELIAGERRWRAAQKAGLERIPAIVQDVSDEKALEMALVENIQRDELNSVEEAHAYQLLVEEFGLTQEEVARRVGRSRAAVANTLRLLRLHKQVQQALLAGELSMGHARALLPLPAKGQIGLAQEIATQGLSVRQVEKRVQRLLKPAAPRSVARKDANTRAAEETLEERWKTRVEIKRRGGGGQIILHFHSEEELDRLYSDLME